MSVLDTRRSPAVCTSKDDLAVLAERCERKRLAPVRSVYLALLEAAGDPGEWSRRMLAERAGVSADMLRQSLRILAEVGFLAEGEGDWRLLSPSADAPALVAPPPPEDPLASLAPGERDRAERLVAWHARQVQPILGRVPRRDVRAVQAAADIARRQPDGAQIKAAMQYALDDRFYADKVLRLSDMRRWWDRIYASYRASLASASRGRGREERPETDWSAVSYEGDRISIS